MLNYIIILIYTPVRLEKLKFKLVLWTISSQIWHAMVKSWCTYFLIWLKDDLLRPLVIGQPRMKSNLPGSKIYLSQIFSNPALVFKESIEKYDFTNMGVFATHLNQSLHCCGSIKPHAMAFFTVLLYLLKQESMITEQYFDLGKALFEFAFVT